MLACLLAAGTKNFGNDNIVLIFFLSLFIIQLTYVFIEIVEFQVHQER